ncbi:MAG: hypothetical protein HWE18_12055 [Gammaproteobacteria bacterium]|nr:hypothetical protein [Gammaproteobacteria bacterium]
MIPVGYMYKSVSKRPDWLNASVVRDIYSVSGCTSKDFDDWVDEWKHNGFWLFDSPKIMQEIASTKGVDLSQMTLFFYKSSDKEWDEEQEEWVSFKPEGDFDTNIVLPKKTKLEGYDVVSFYLNASCECSPLSCNHLAESIKVNEHCLFESYEEAEKLIKSGELDGCEPGPYRVFEVHSVQIA